MISIITASSMFQEAALEVMEPEQKSLSIYQLILDGGVGGQIIIALLFVLLVLAIYI